VLLKRTLVVPVLVSIIAAGPAVAQENDPGVAVLDTGTNAVGVNVADGFNFLNNTPGTSDVSSNGHGTTVSQIINQEATGIPQYQFVLNSSSTAAAEAALQRAVANPAIRVVAWSTAVIDVPSSGLPAASNAGKFVAIRTGNDAAANPAPAAAAAAGLPGVVVVTGTNGSGGLLPNSNACGTAAARCVGVRGTTEFNNFSGTSFSAARLAGIAAQVLRATPFLSAEQLAGVIFATARNTGDPRLGNGFIANADQVINSPAGAASIGDSGSSGLGVAAVLLGAAAGAALLMGNDEELEKTLVLDSFGRPFEVDLTELMTIDDERGSISSFFQSLEHRHDSKRMILSENLTLDASYITTDHDVVDPGKYFAFEDDPAFRDENIEWALSLRGDYANGFHYRLDKNRDPAAGFGVMDSVYPASPGGRSYFLSGQSFAMPVLSFSAVADSASFGFAGSSGFALDFGVVSTDEDRAYGRDSVAAVMEGSYSFDDRGEISIQVGQLQEDGSLFGGASKGTFSVDETRTLAASLAGSFRVGDNAWLIGNYGVAHSDVDASGKGMLSNFSSLQSDWFGIGMVAERLFGTRDQAGVAFSRPLRVTGGEVDMSVPYARDFEGNIYADTDRISLEPAGREYTLESYYLHPLGRRSSLGAYVMLRREPNHVAGAGTELTFLASYRARF